MEVLYKEEEALWIGVYTAVTAGYFRGGYHNADPCHDKAKYLADKALEVFQTRFRKKGDNKLKEEIFNLANTLDEIGKKMGDNQFYYCADQLRKLLKEFYGPPKKEA